MGIVRFFSAVFIAGVMIPIFGLMIAETLIGFSNGHWSAPLDALSSAAGMLPLALLSAPLFGLGAFFVAALSLGLERLLRRRSISAWLAHSAAIGLLQIVWVNPARTVTIVRIMGSWLLVSAAMWSVLSRGRPSTGERWS